jgi:hypothetical protein
MAQPPRGSPDPDPEYDPESDTYRIEWEPASEEDLATLIVVAVAEITDVDHTELTPLNDVIDPDALNAIFAPRKDGLERSGGRVLFSLSGHEITVDSSGRVVIDTSDEGDSR